MVSLSAYVDRNGKLRKFSFLGGALLVFPVVLAFPAVWPFEPLLVSREVLLLLSPQRMMFGISKIFWKNLKSTRRFKLVAIRDVSILTVSFRVVNNFFIPICGLSKSKWHCFLKLIIRNVHDFQNFEKFLGFMVSGFKASKAQTTFFGDADVSSQCWLYGPIV